MKKPPAQLRRGLCLRGEGQPPRGKGKLHAAACTTVAQNPRFPSAASTPVGTITKPIIPLWVGKIPSRR